MRLHRENFVRIHGWVAVATVLVGALGLAYWLGSVTAPPVLRITDDRLGPDSGERVDAYVERARRSLAVAPNDEPRWALISPTTEWTPGEVWRRYGAVPGLDRIGQVLVRVQIPGVQTPLATVPPGQSAAGLAAVNELAAYQMPGLVAPGERGTQIAQVSMTRLRAGTPAVVGIVVHGTGDSLRTAASRATRCTRRPGPSRQRRPLLAYAIAPVLHRTRRTRC